MIVVNWAQGVNKNVMQSSTWTHELGIIADNTRCGVRKVRANNVYAPPQYSVTMHFTLAEKNLFMDWYDDVCRKGLFPFRFPDIEKRGSESIYSFAPNSMLSFSNLGGQIIEVQMTWEKM